MKLKKLKEHIIGQAFKREVRLPKGLTKKHRYISPLFFGFAFSWGLFYILVGGLVLILSIAGIVKARPLSLVAIVGISIYFLISIHLLSIGVKLLKRLILLFLKTNRKFKLISFPIMLVLTLLVILILFFIYQMALK